MLRQHTRDQSTKGHIVTRAILANNALSPFKEVIKLVRDARGDSNASPTKQELQALIDSNFTGIRSKFAWMLMILDWANRVCPDISPQIASWIFYDIKNHSRTPKDHLLVTMQHVHGSTSGETPHKLAAFYNAEVKGIQVLQLLKQVLLQSRDLQLPHSVGNLAHISETRAKLLNLCFNFSADSANLSQNTSLWMLLLDTSVADETVVQHIWPLLASFYDKDWEEGYARWATNLATLGNFANGSQTAQAMLSMLTAFYPPDALSEDNLLNTISTALRAILAEPYALPTGEEDASSIQLPCFDMSSIEDFTEESIDAMATRIFVLLKDAIAKKLAAAPTVTPTPSSSPKPSEPDDEPRERGHQVGVVAAAPPAGLRGLRA